MQTNNEQTQPADYDQSEHQARIWPLVVLLVLLIAIPIGFLVLNKLDKTQASGLRKSLVGMSYALVAPAEDTRTDARSRSEDEQFIALAQRGVTRLKSFTSKDHYENVRGMRPLVTERFWKQLDESITTQEAKQTADPADQTFYGIVTTPLSSKVISKDIDAVDIQVQTKREEVKGLDTQPEPLTELFTVHLDREQNEWLIDSITP